MNGTIRVNGSEISAPKWLATAVPIITAIVGAVMGILAMLLVVPSADDVQAAVKQRAEVADTRWKGHERDHEGVERRLQRIEEKLDLLLQRED